MHSLIKLHDDFVVKIQQMYIDVELFGIYIDPIKLREARLLMLKKSKTIEMKLKRYGNINWNSPEQISTLLYDRLKLHCEHYTDKGKNSTREEALLNLAEIHEVPKLILEHRGAVKNLGFLTSWGKLCDNRGFLHPKFNIAGTVTGRPSCSDPNLQQTPRNNIMRSCFGPPPGYDMLEIDYSQIELRLVADDANDKTMLKIFKEGGDIHSATARDIVGGEPTKENRFQSKAINFGFIYGLSAENYIKYAWLNFGLRVDIEESTEFRNGFFKKYSSLLSWHRKKKKEAYDLGYVTTWTGRRRHLPAAQAEEYSFEKSEALRQAINAPIQGGAAELTLAAAIEIREKFGNLVNIVGSVHDAILMYIKKSHTMKLLPEIVSIMEHPKLLDVFNKTFNVPITVEVKIGNWGIGKEIRI